VGEYLPLDLSITLGRLKIDVSDNCHSDGKPRDMGRLKVFGIKIHKNRTTVLDFSNKPEVIFTSPAKSDRIKPGEELKVWAVLVDPKLDIMVRGLEGKPYQGLSFSYTIVAAIVLLAPAVFWFCSPRLRKRYRMLPIASAIGIIVLIGSSVVLHISYPPSIYSEISPEVLITRANGERVATGVMPFG
jgi:hypothetical protein